MTKKYLTVKDVNEYQLYLKENGEEKANVFLVSLYYNIPMEDLLLMDFREFDVLTRTVVTYMTSYCRKGSDEIAEGIISKKKNIEIINRNDLVDLE